MSLNIKFQNTKGKEISIQQKNNSNDYFELNFIDDSLKIKKLFYNNVIVKGEYYLSDNENVNSITPELDNSYRWSIFSEKQIVNNYTVWKVNYYIENNVSIFYDKVVLDSEGDVIASIGYDNNNIPNGGFKKFALSGKEIIYSGQRQGTFDEGEYVIFSFDSVGIKKIDSSSDLFLKPFFSLSIFLMDMQGGPVLSLMTPEMITYYTNLLPLVPNF